MYKGANLRCRNVLRIGFSTSSSDAPVVILAIGRHMLRGHLGMSGGFGRVTIMLAGYLQSGGLRRVRTQQAPVVLRHVCRPAAVLRPLPIGDSRTQRSFVLGAPRGVVSGSQKPPCRRHHQPMALVIVTEMLKLFEDSGIPPSLHRRNALSLDNHRRVEEEVENSSIISSDRGSIMEGPI